MLYKSLMALKAIDEKHAAQILAGTTGRTKGHDFELNLTAEINSLIDFELLPDFDTSEHLFVGMPGPILLTYILKREKIKPNSVRAWWLGGLATSGAGDELRDSSGTLIAKSKSDIVIDFTDGSVQRYGISVKTCYAKSPTNDQIFFTTASAFCNLLRANGIEVSADAEKGLKMFCGDVGFRPIDMNTVRENVDGSRWFWEELPDSMLSEWHNIFTDKQYEVSELLFKKAYKAEPIAPEYLIHLTKGYESVDTAEFALFSIPELIEESIKFGSFHTRPYTIKKGSHKNDPNIHQAPRFGFIQMQRGGQKQHPTQLQFNLMAGYFYKL